MVRRGFTRMCRAAGKEQCHQPCFQAFPFPTSGSLPALPEMAARNGLWTSVMQERKYVWSRFPRWHPGGWGYVYYVTMYVCIGGNTVSLFDELQTEKQSGRRRVWST